VSQGKVNFPPISGRSLARTQRRLLVTKLASETRAERDATPLKARTATIEVTQEALLRRWPTLADLLREDRDALLLL
jgi:hypothetical protein